MIQESASCPGRGAALLQCCSAEPGPTPGRWAPDQQRTTSQVRRAAQHPGHDHRNKKGGPSAAPC